MLAGTDGVGVDVTIALVGVGVATDGVGVDVTTAHQNFQPKVSTPH